MIARTSVAPRPPGENPQVEKGSEIHLRLYVASSTPNSQRAKANLANALLAPNPLADYRVEIIDVLADGRRVVADSVIVTPTLIAIGPKRRAVMIGDLSDAGKLEGFLKSAADVS